MKMNRRTLLRATGVAMGLPVLESFGASSSQKSPRRMLAINQDLGFIPKLFFPKGEGRNYELSNYLEKIAGHRDQFTVFSGLSHPGVDGGHRRYQNAIHCYSKMLRREGPLAFYRGAGVNVVRAAPSSAVQFCVFEGLKKLAHRSGRWARGEEEDEDG